MFVGGLVFLLLMVFVIDAAIGALNIPSVTTFMGQVLDYLPNVIVAVIIFVIAAAISGLVAAAAKKTMGDTLDFFMQLLESAHTVATKPQETDAPSKR